MSRPVQAPPARRAKPAFWSISRRPPRYGFAGGGPAVWFRTALVSALVIGSGVIVALLIVAFL
jgi:hypothetical protein